MTMSSASSEVSSFRRCTARRPSVRLTRPLIAKPVQVALHDVAAVRSAVQEHAARQFHQNNAVDAALGNRRHFQIGVERLEVLDQFLAQLGTGRRGPTQSRQDPSYTKHQLHADSYAAIGQGVPTTASHSSFRSRRHVDDTRFASLCAHRRTPVTHVNPDQWSTLVGHRPRKLGVLACINSPNKAGQ